MLPDSSCKRGQGGFSLFEVAVVLSVGLILIAIAFPRMTNVIATQKLRGSMTTASSFLQNVRMLAIKKNRTMMALSFNRTDPPYSLVYWTKEPTDSSSFSPKFSQVELEAPITPMGTPMGPGAPAAITNTALGLLVDPEVTAPSFNSRGLPCKFNSLTGQCENKAFITYFKDNRIGGSGGWAAVSLTPAGRIKRWFWTGSAWTD
jgi:prepilin-type N-terminal cleavage/methylation domain-containing protein